MIQIKSMMLYKNRLESEGKDYSLSHFQFQENKNTMEKTLLVLFSVLCVSLICLSLSFSPVNAYGRSPLRFNPDGRFKILQVSDMHYGLGKESQCSDVSPAERPYCSDLNTTAFLHRTIASEKPDLIVFSGTNFVREKKTS